MSGGAEGRCWLFVVEMDPGGDGFLRALAPFPVQGAEVTRLDLRADGDLARLEIEAQGLCGGRAGRLQARLQTLTGVRSVACGWR